MAIPQRLAVTRGKLYAKISLQFNIVSLDSTFLNGIPLKKYAIIKVKIETTNQPYIAEI